eukprot:CAMPEP_0197441710 /NCGR_PEP_ID=MMETSP1175-20131217/7920_1 /TAXON_ID=1003142 /ORGANISM="Triceratium dubium, Strain CCMP147" /LENGTH=332 /DNA_ID=CAMNT_0042972035 /DNA_START=105 /DNA_END=1103 /DNA_ORIENTATION=+
MTSEAEDKAKVQESAVSAENLKENLGKAAELAQVVAKPAIQFATFAFPYVVAFCRTAHSIYVKLPHDETEFLIGAIFCFFGGIYPTLFAAIIAAEHGGRQTLMEAISALTEEATKIVEASKKDDELDEDGDGTKDVDQITGKELLMRKAKLVMVKMNPDKVNDAMASMYKVWLSVAAVLTVQFARTIAVALSIADFIKKPVDHYIAPVIQAATPDEYDKWVPVMLGWLAKSIAMSIAWYIEAIRSAFTSALKGGLMMSRALMKIARKKGLTFVPEKEEDTNLDEITSYVFAGLGFYFQFKLGFDISFPFNIILAPFELAEYWIRWTITTKAA